MLVFLTTVSAYNQDLVEDSYNPFTIHQDEMREWVDAFNAQNVNPQSYNKSEMTHRMDSMITEFFDFPSTFPRTSRLEFDLTEERDISYLSRLVSGSWVPEGYFVQNYDQNNRRVFSYSADWDGDYDNVSEQDGIEFQIFIYNDQGLLSEHHIQNKEEYIQQLPADLITHAYNDEGLLVRSQAKQWSIALDSFEIRRQFNFGYKEGLLDYFVDYSLGSDRQLVATDSFAFIYNEKNLLDKESMFQMTDGFPWGLVREDLYEYNNNDQISKVKSQFGFSLTVDGSPLIVDTFFYQYYNYGSLKDIAQIEADTFPNDYILAFELNKRRQKHDSTVRFDQVIRFRNLVRFHEENHMILEYSEAVSRRGDISCEDLGYGSCLRNTRTSSYFYSEINTTSTEEIAPTTSLYTISPNPSHNIIQVLSTEADPSAIVLHLTDMQGRRVLSKETRPGASVDISYLTSGVYIYQVMQDDVVVTGKVVVE